MGIISVYDKYKHWLLPKTQQVLETSFDKPEVEHRISRALIKKSTVMPFVVRVRDKFDQVDAIHRICKELDHMVEAGALAGSFKGEALFYKPNPPVIEKPPGYDMWSVPSYNQHSDSRFVGAMLHVYGGSFYELRTFYSHTFCTSEGEIPPFYPQFEEPKKCGCGVETLYGAKATKQMHADWCRLSVYPREG